MGPNDEIVGNFENEGSYFELVEGELDGVISVGDIKGMVLGFRD